MKTQTYKFIETYSAVIGTGGIAGINYKTYNVGDVIKGEKIGEFVEVTNNLSPNTQIQIFDGIELLQKIKIPIEYLQKVSSVTISKNTKTILLSIVVIAAIALFLIFKSKK